MGAVFDNNFADTVKDGRHRYVKGKGPDFDYFADDGPKSNTIIQLYGEGAPEALIPASAKKLFKGLNIPAETLLSF